MHNLNKNNYLIIGGNSGIGLALAKQLREREANIWLASRNQKAAADSLNAPHLSLDVTGETLGTLADFVPEQLHGIAYCPGTITLKPFQRLSIADFRNDMEINLFGAVKVIQAVFPMLKKGAPASIVMFSTVASLAGMNFHASIAAAKAAVEGFAKSLAAEFAGANIRVNVIAPSITETPLAGHLLNNEHKIEASKNRHPIKKIGAPDDVASLAAYLLSPESGWITGQVIAVDGGLSALRPL